MLKIISADERMSNQGIKCMVLGEYGVGKTTLLRTLPEATTLFVDMEAGELAVRGWKGDSIGTTEKDKIRDWESCRKIAAYIGGPNPHLRPDQAYSSMYYDRAVADFGDPSKLDKYTDVFLDSISVASRLCKQFADSEVIRTGQSNNKFAAYGILAQEMIDWMTQLQHAARKNVFFVGLLNKKKDDFGRVDYLLQIEGSKAGLEVPAIVDQVVTMADVMCADGIERKALITKKKNDWNFPAKDRSGALDPLEPPHLGKLMEKILNGVNPNYF